MNIGNGKNKFLLAAMVFAGLSMTGVSADAYNSLSDAVSSPDKTKDYRNYNDQTLSAPLGDLQGNILTVKSYYGGDYGQKFYYNGFAYNGGGNGGVNVLDGQYFSAALAKYIGFSKPMDGLSRGGVINNAGNTSFVGWFGDGRRKYEYNHASLGGSIYNANTGIMTMDKYTDITTYTGSEVLEFWGGNDRNQTEIDANAMYGGAIYNAGKMYIVQDRNLDTDYSSSGVNISEIQFEGNGASVKGGAIYNAAGAEFTLYGTNNTRILFADSKPNVVASNSAADGGAIYNDGGVINLGVDDSQFSYMRIGWIDSSSSEHPDTGDNSIAGTGVLNLNKPSIQYIKTPDLEQYSKDVIAAKEAGQPLPDYNDYLTTLNINPGKIIINADVEHYYGDVNLYGGTLSFASAYNTTFFNGAAHFNVLGDAIIDLTSTASIFYNHLASHLSNLSIADDTTLTLKTALTYNGGGVPYYNTFDADNVQIGNNAKIHWVFAGSAADKTSVVIPITTTLGEYADVSIAENAVTTSVYYSVNKTGSQIDVAVADAAPWGPTVSYNNMTLKQAANNDADNKTFSIGYKIHKTGQPYLTFGGNIGEVVNNLAVNGNYRSDITYDLTVSAENPDGDNYSGFVLNSDSSSLKMTNQKWADFKDFAVQANKGTLKLNNSEFTNTDGSTLILNIDNANVETFNLKFTNNTDAAIQINTDVNNSEYTISSINKNTEFANNNGAIKFNTDKDVILNLNATEGSSLNFLTPTDTINMGTGANSQINVNKGNFTYYDEKTASYVTPEMNGDIVFNSKIDNVDLNIYNGTISLGKAGHEIDRLNVLTNTVINLIDNKTDTVNINTLNGNFKIDLLVDAIKGSTGYETDVINLANAPDNTNINIYAINIVSDDDNVDIQLINDNDESSNITYTTDATTYLGSYKYVFTADDTVKGLFHGTKSTSGIIDFNTLFTEESGGEHQLPFARTYSMDKDITVKGGVMANDTVFNLLGNNYSFTLGAYGKEYRYLEATNKSTLNIFNIGKFTRDVDAEGNVTVTIDHEGLKNFRPQYSGYYADHFVDGDAGSVINIDGLVAHDIYTGTYKDDSIAHLIDSDGGDVTIKNSLFSDLHFKGYESGYPSVVIRTRLDGNLTIENSIFENNEVKNGYNNGFIFIQSSSNVGNYGQLTINDSIFRNNTSNDFNAVINNQRIFSVISDSLFENNGSTITKSSDASGYYSSFWGPVTLATAEIHNSMFKGNYVNSTYDYDKVQSSFVRGGAIDAEGWIKIWDSSFIGNYAKSKHQNPSGGALYGLGDVLVYGSLMSNGNPLEPEDILTTDISTVTSTSTFKDNYVSSEDTNAAYGGAVRCNYDGLFDGTVVDGNYAESKYRVYGGAVYATKNIVVENSVFKNNRIKNEYNKELTYSNQYLQAYGGAIATTMTTDTSYNYSMLIDNSIFDNNKIESARTYSYGGAVLYGEVSNSNLIKNSVFTNNSNTLNTTDDDTTAQAYGGAVYTKYMVFENDRFINNTVTASGSTSDKASGGAIYAAKKILVDDSYFEGNKAISDYSANGGAIYAATNIDSTNSTFIGNKAISNDERYGAGGAIYTSLNSSSFDNATFTSNEASKNGGAISAGSGLVITDSSFTTNTAGGSGGAILGYNGSVDNSTFTGNTAGDNGGAIYTSNLAITNSLFTENTAVNEAGAVYSAGNITGSTFTKNKTTDENGSGGAITGYSSNHVSDSHFGISDDSTSGNTAAYGGAARFYREKYGYGGTSVIKNSDFNYNSASKMGGAIYLAGGQSDSDYINYDWHYDEEKQEWVRDYLGVLTSSSENELVVIDSTFNNNTTAGVDGLGKGAITVHGGNLKLAAVENDLTFTGNGTALSVLSTYSDDVTDNPDEPSRPLHTIIYGGVVNLNAADGHKIVFNDKIDSGVIAGDTPENQDRAILNINQAINYESGYDEETGEYIYTDLPTTGKIALNADMTGYHGAVNQYGGTLALGSSEEANMLTNASSFSVLGDSSIDLQNTKIDNVVFANPVTVNGALNLALDINGEEYSADLFGGEYAEGSTSSITINAINFINNLSTSKDFTIASGTIAQHIALATGDALKITGGTGSYEFSYLNGVLSVNVTAAPYAGTLIDALQNRVIDEQPAPDIYILSENFTATENFGNLTGEDREFTLNGNDKTISADSHSGIIVSNGQTLNINDVAEFSGTTDFAVDNAGTLNINNATFTNNTTADIKNTSVLNLSGNNTISKIVDNGTETSTGITNVNGGTTTISANGSVTQNVINMQGGRLFSANGTNISANIIGNENYKSNYSTAEAMQGGVINNAGTTSSISGTFKDNSLTSTSSNAAGGAIHNEGTISSISGSYINNSVNAYNIAYGGAVDNYSGTISSLSGTFTNNSAISQYGIAYGGAISSREHDLTINNSTFTGNTVTGGTSAFGSAIYFEGRNYDTYEDKLDITKSTFTENGAGGVLHVDGGKVTITDSNFTNNAGDAISLKATSKWVYDGGVLKQKNSPVIASIVADTEDISISNNSGTGIKLTGNAAGISALNLYAKNHNILIENNTSGAIITQGALPMLTLNADSNQTITINDYIAANVGMIINGDYSDETVSHAGTVELNGALIFGNDNSTLNLNGGTLKLGTTAAGSEFKNIAFANNPTLDLQNSSAQTTSVTSISGNSKLNIDIDFTGTDVVGDNINITTGGETGVITLNSIAALDSDSAIREFSNLAILTGETTGVTLAISDALQADTRFNGAAVETLTWESDYTDTATFSNTVFTNTEYSETKQKQLSVVDNTKLSFAENTTIPKHATGNTTTQDVLQALNQSTSATRFLTTDDATAIYTVGDDLGATGTGVLTVGGSVSDTNKSTLNMETKTGFDLSAADENTMLALSNLNITNINDTADGGLIKNTGNAYDVTLTNVSLENTTHYTILNNKELTLEGTNNLGKGINGTGNTTVSSGTTTVDTIIQKSISIVSDSGLKTATVTTTDGISNDGTLTLTGTANANAITGEGNIVIAGNINNTGSISQAITVNASKTLTTAANLIGGAVTNGGTVEITGGALNQTINGGAITISATGDNVVTSTVANLGGTITNSGNLLLSGSLDKAIAGNTGITKINENLTMTSTGSVAGTLDMNTGTLNLVDNSGVHYSMSKITGSGNLAIDFDGTNNDSITVTSSEEGTITLTALNGFTKGQEAVAATTILEGASNITLEISNELRTAYDDTVITPDNYEADIVLSAASWTDEFKNRYYDISTGKQITVDNSTTNKTLAYVYNVQNIYDSTKDISLGDTLALINQKEDTTRTFTTDSATAIYNVSSALGTTGAGKITVQGVIEGENTSILNMAGNTGFVIGAGAEVELNTVKVTNTSNAEGAFINNTAGTVTLNNVEVAENTANAINNANTLNLEGSNIINTGVTGTNGTTNVNSSLTIVNSITQKLINILTGAKLASKGNVTTGTGDSEGIRNAVENGLELSGGTLTGNITGIGSTNINGNVSVADGSTISQGINIINGKLTTSANSIGGTVSNSEENGLEITGGTLTKAVAGTGSTVINTASNVIIGDGGSIDQLITVQAGTLKTDVTKLTQDITSNSGIVELTGTGTLTKTIAGNTTISGSGITNSGSLDNITITDGGVFTSDLNDISGTISNSGTLNLSGELNKAISGSGTTYLNNNITMSTGASVEGTLNVNDKTLNLSSESGNDFTVGTLTGSGSLTINLFQNDTGFTSEKITAASYDGLTSLTVADINDTVQNPDAPFSITVLGGYSGSAMSLSETITTRYNGVKNVDKQITTALEATSDWTNNKYGAETWTEYYTKNIAANQGNIDYTITKTGESEHIFSTGDTLVLLNTTNDFTDRKMITDNASETYTLGANLGVTSAGSMTVQGKNDGTNISTIDMNGKTGFELTNDNTTLILTDVKFTNSNATSVSPISVQNSTAVVNMTNVIINDENINNISNNGTITLTGNNNVDVNITGNGSTSIISGNTVINEITQSTISVANGASAQAETITTTSGTINDGTLTISGATSNTDIFGSGATTVVNDLSNTGTISQNEIVIGSDAHNVSLTNTGAISADTISVNGSVTNTGNITVNNITNAGTITVNNGTEETSALTINGAGVTLAGTVNGTGSTVVNGSVTNNANISTDVVVTGAMITSADNVTGVITNENTLVLTGGDIQNTIVGAGTTTVSGNITNTTNSNIGNAIAVSEGASITTNADNIGNGVRNSGTVDLTGGTLNSVVIGGNIGISGDVTTSANNLRGETTNAASTLTLTNGEITNSISGAGNTNITGEVVNNAAITQTNIANYDVLINNATITANITNTGTLTSSADNIAGTVNNTNTYNVSGGTISNDVTGAGTININGDTTVNTNISATGNVKVSEGVRLTEGAGTTNIFTNANEIELGNGATLSVMNNSATPTVINNIAVAADSIANVEMDWGDVINSSSGDIDGSLSITKIDLSQTDGSTSSYAFSNLGEQINISNNVDVIAGDTTSNFVSYNVTSGQITSVRNNLKQAVDDTTTGDVSTYVMTGNETAGGDTLTGKLTVKGNGNAITSGGIIIGDSTTGGADLTLEDVSIQNVNAGTEKAAIVINGGNKLEIKAENSDVSIQGTSGTTNAIYLESDVNGTSNAIINVQSSKTANIDDDIRSNDVNNKLTLTGNGDINLKGVLDPLTVDMNAANVYRFNNDIAIVWNLNSGILHYANDLYLSGNGNTLNFNGGSLDLINGAANNISLTGLNVNANSNIFVDVDAANQVMDTLSGATTTASANLNVAGMNIYGTPTASEFTTTFVDASLGNTALIGHVTSSVSTVNTGVYKYLVSYVDDGTTGKFKYNVNIGGNPYASYNPAVYSSSVAMQSAYLTQISNYDTAFGNLDQTMLMTQEQRKALKYGNKYASNDETNPQVYSPLYSQNENKGIWFRPYVSFEKVQLSGGPDVNNVMYGSLVGGDTDIFAIGNNGWEGQVSVYAGYNGSHQTYDGIGIYQNGGTLGATGALFKGNFFTALTASVGAQVADIKTGFGHNDLTMLTTGVASKTGYNWELFDGKMIIQPSWTMSYTFLNPFNNYTMANGVRLENSALNAIQLNPGLKIIGNLKNGWQPYIGVNMRWNIMDDTKVNANYIDVPETSVKPYVEYGVGLQKTVGERFTGFGQAMVRGGGRNGISFTFGFRWALGKLIDKFQQKDAQKTKETKATKSTKAIKAIKEEKAKSQTLQPQKAQITTSQGKQINRQLRKFN